MADALMGRDGWKSHKLNKLERKTRSESVALCQAGHLHATGVLTLQVSPESRKSLKRKLFLGQLSFPEDLHS